MVNGITTGLSMSLTSNMIASISHPENPVIAQICSPQPITPTSLLALLTTQAASTSGLQLRNLPLLTQLAHFPNTPFSKPLTCSSLPSGSTPFHTQNPTKPTNVSMDRLQSNACRMFLQALAYYCLSMQEQADFLKVTRSTILESRQTTLEARQMQELAYRSWFMLYPSFFRTTPQQMYRPRACVYRLSFSRLTMPPTNQFSVRFRVLGETGVNFWARLQRLLSRLGRAMVLGQPKYSVFRVFDDGGQWWIFYGGRRFVLGGYPLLLLYKFINFNIQTIGDEVCVCVWPNLNYDLQYCILYYTMPCTISFFQISYHPIFIM